MAETVTTTEQTPVDASGQYIGRRRIYCPVEDITGENIVAVLNVLLPYHTENMMAEEYLYWYRRGVQPILNRTKQVRPEINNKVVENHAAEIVAFKNGYFLTQPAFYVARKDVDDINDKVQILNEMLYLSGKQNVDNQLTDWFHTVGVGVLYVEPYSDSECPVRVYALDPRSSFVAYSRRPGNEPVLGVNVVISGRTETNVELTFDVYTRTRYFKLRGGMTGMVITGAPVVATAYELLEERENVLGEIPIVEYQYENNRMSAFEAVMPLLDAINRVESNRMDGIEQFIQSLMIFYNCQLGEDENGNQITPRYIREAGAIFLKSIGQDKADLKILSEQLNQTETQVLIDYMYQQVLSICGMPSTTKGGTSTSDTGAAVLYRDGWYQADTYARNTEDLFKVSNRYFDRIFTKILRMRNVVDIGLADFELQFTRNETANLLVKTQAALNLKNLGFSPELAFGKSGVSSDPVADVALCREYIDRAWGNAQQPEQIDETRTDIVE
jgi:SPP1 family phage portal protein